MNAITKYEFTVPVQLDPALLQQVTDLAGQATAITSVTPDNKTTAEGLLNDIVSVTRKIDAEKTKLKAPALTITRAIDDAVRTSNTTLATAKTHLLAALSVFNRKVAELDAQRQAAAKAEHKEVKELAKAFNQPPPPPPIFEKAASSSVKMRTEYTVVIQDKKLVPMFFGDVQIAELKDATVKAMLKNGAKIPGLALESHDVPVFGGSR